MNDDIQRELLRDTVDPERAPSIAVNMEMGHRNQQRISSNNNGATGSTTNAVQSFNRFRGANARGNQSGRVTANRTAIGQCRGCGQAWTTTHRQVCPALGMKCNHCGLLNHFAKVCRKKLNNTRICCQENCINNVETETSTGQNTNSENQSVQNKLSSTLYYDYDSSDDNYVAMVESTNTLPVALQNLTIKIDNTDCHLLLDSGSGCTIINMFFSREIMFNCAQSQWSEKKPLELKSFSNDIVEALETLKTPIRFNDWKIQKAKITVVAEGFWPILGRDLFDQLGITISQKPCPNM